jgi:ATP-binding cassette, subfamily F, member 2
MPSEASKRRKLKLNAKRGQGKPNCHPPCNDSLDALQDAHSARNTTGVLASHPQGLDVQFVNFSLTFHGIPLFADTTLELNFGRRYGLIGRNGSGKSTFLNALGERDVDIPEHMDIFHLKSEIEAGEKTALEAVLDVNNERSRLEKEADAILDDEGGESERLQDIYERLESLDASTSEARCARLLHGLGFDNDMQNKKTKHFSGGWRMRIALARALFVQPSILLLDEPTNHLDLDACVWLEEELKKYHRILVLVSHSQDFLNGVCTNIMHLNNKELTYYSGNYDQFMKTRSELELRQMKQYQSEQTQIAEMKNYIARFGHGSAKLARQAQSKEKVLAKMMSAGLTKKVTNEVQVQFDFPDCGNIPPPVLMVQHVSFAYPDGSQIYNDLNFGLDLDSRLALVGPNGAGKSTLLKLLVGELTPINGTVQHNSHLKIARFHQHLADQIDFSLSAIEFIQKEFPSQLVNIEDARKAIGRYGLTGAQQVMPIENLSDGQRVRIVFAWLAYSKPHLLMLDEPTNHLDMETIDALAEALVNFSGGVVLVSHDFRLINQVAKEIWICENQQVTKWVGGIQEYKHFLKTKVECNL